VGEWMSLGQSGGRGRGREEGGPLGGREGVGGKGKKSDFRFEI